MTLAASDKSGLINIWNLSDGSLMTSLSGHEGTVSSLASIMPNKVGIKLASCSSDATVKLWSLTELIHTFESSQGGHTAWIRVIVSWSDQGKQMSYLASGGDDKTVKVWDLEQARFVLIEFFSLVFLRY